MAILISILLAVLIIAVLLYPFVKARRRGRPPSVQNSSIELGSQRHTIYEEIKTLQLERDLDKVEEDDYQHSLQQLRLQAAAALRDEEQLRKKLLEVEQALEEEIQAARRGRVKKRGSNPGKNELL